MKLFINSGVLERLRLDKVISQKNGNTIIAIPNYCEELHKHQDIKFVFEKECIDNLDFSKDILLEGISLHKKENNCYTISSNDEDKENYMYALVRSTDIVPDDIFIPSFMKDNVKVLQRIRFVYVEPDYGDFLSNIYLLRIKLEQNESLPLYFSNEKLFCIDDHYVVYKVNSYKVSKKLETFIYVNKSNEEQYISLSKL